MIIREFHVAAVMLSAVAGLLFASCRSGKEQASAGSQWQRPPIVETTEEKLQTEAMMIEAKRQHEAQNFAAERILYHQILAKDSTFGAACYELSLLCAAEKMTDSALYYVRRAVRCNGDNVWYLLTWARLCSSVGLYAESAEAMERVVQKNPDVPDYYYELSNTWLKANDYKKAVDVLNRLERRVGITELVSMQKAELWNAMGKGQKALAEIEALAAVVPQESKYNAMLAKAYMQDKKYDKAKQCYDRIAKANPDDEYVHFSLAEYYKQTGDPQHAYEELKMAFAQETMPVRNKLQLLGSFYSNEEFYGEHSQYAFALLDDLMRQCDDSTDYAAFYGDVLRRQNRYSEAARQFSLHLSKDSSNYAVWEALLISDMQDTASGERMLTDAQRAMNLFPFHQLPVFVAAVYYHDNDDFETAIANAKKCESMGFDKGYLELETYNLIAECYNRLNDTACYAYYKKCLSLSPDDSQILNSYAYRLALDGQHLDEAEKMSRRSLEKEADSPYFLDTYAWIMYKMGNQKEARKYIEKAKNQYDRHGVGMSAEVKEHWDAIMTK